MPKEDAGTHHVFTLVCCCIAIMEIEWRKYEFVEQYMNNQRIEWIDTLKFIGMFYIYLGHLGAVSGKLYPFVFSFHVPLFFFISGLFYKKSMDVLDSIHIIKNAFVKIIIPYAVFSLIGILVYTLKWNLPTGRIQEMLLNAVMGIRNQVPITSLWFLPCLFVVIIYHTIANLVFRKAVFIFIASLLAFCLTPLWGKSMPSVFFNIDTALHYLVYFSFGVCISNKVKYEWPECYEGSGRVIITAIVIISFSYFAYAYQYGTLSLFSGIANAELRYLVYFFVTCFMFLPSIALAYWVNLKSFQHLGRNSLLLCGTEQIVKVMIPTALAVIGIKIELKDPLQAVLFTSACFVFSYFTVLKIYTSVSLVQKNQADQVLLK